MFIAKGLQKDPDNEGWVLGWGVIRLSPWSLAGVYATKELAEMKAMELGNNYEVHQGSHRSGSDDFAY